MGNTENSVDSNYTLNDPGLDPFPTPCPDCGRTYLNCESVVVRVPIREEPVWFGCVDCWLRRTSPEVCETFVAKEE